MNVNALKYRRVTLDQKNQTKRIRRMSNNNKNVYEKGGVDRR